MHDFWLPRDNSRSQLRSSLLFVWQDGIWCLACWLYVLETVAPDVLWLKVHARHSCACFDIHTDGLSILIEFLQDVKKHDDPDLVVLATDECLFADEGFRWLHLPSFHCMCLTKSNV